MNGKLNGMRSFTKAYCKIACLTGNRQNVLPIERKRMSITLTTLKRDFPRGRKNQTKAVTGRIPMRFFELNEDSIRAVMHRNGLTALYRDPIQSGQHNTTRENAQSVILYPKG